MNRLFLFFIPLLLSGCSLFATSKPAAVSEPRAVDLEVPAAVTQQPEPAPISTPTPPSTPTIKEFSLTAFTWAFQPDTITVKKGDRVRLSITSTDVTHGFALPDFAVSQNLEPGKTAVVEFTADKQGRFSFFCSVFCGDGHRGMKGLLIVE